MARCLKLKFFWGGTSTDIAVGFEIKEIACHRFQSYGRQTCGGISYALNVVNRSILCMAHCFTASRPADISVTGATEGPSFMNTSYNAFL